MASLRARHSRTCALGGVETRAPTREREPIVGCSCKPTFSIRGASGNGHERIGHDLRDALRALAKRNVAEDEGAVIAASILFRDWAKQWLASLENKQTTAVSYQTTIKYAVRDLGHKTVRRITTADVLSFTATLRLYGCGDSTRAKHLRVLSACLQSAVQHGYAAANPVTRIPRGEKPRARHAEASFFEDAELPKLIAAQDDQLWRTLLLVALKTGLRLGELTGLVWPDVDLTGSVVHVRRTVAATARRAIITTPKSHEKREVELTEDVVRLLGEWWGEGQSGGFYSRHGRTAKRGVPTRTALEAGVRFDFAELVFPRFAVGGFIPDYQLREVALYGAMNRAGIPRVGPTPSPRTFHSLRHTYARICLEHGCLETWLQRQLGHSSLAVTTGIYGHWSKAARKVQAAKLEGAFVV